MKIKMSKAQWEKIGQSTGWKRDVRDRDINVDSLDIQECLSMLDDIKRALESGDGITATKTSMKLSRMLGSFHKIYDIL